MGAICADSGAGRNLPNETIHRFTQYAISDKERSVP